MKKYTVNKFIAGMANFLSTALSPLLMPTYGVFLVFWVSVLCLLPYGQRVTHLLVCMGITCIIPLIFLNVLRHFKLVKDIHVDVREQRLIPYLFTAVCYGVSAYYLYYWHSPRWFVMFMVGSAITVVVMALINLTWKISAHMAGIGGLIGGLIPLSMSFEYNMTWWMCCAIIFAGMLGTSRMILRQHSLGQIIVGFFVGFFSAFCIIYKYTLI